LSPGKARGGSSPPSQALLTPEQYLELQNSYRATIVQTLGGLFLLLGLYLTWRRVAATERQVEIAGEGQITERFTRAIDQLGSDKLEIRLGGIYALERIARDSEKDHWPIMEVLTAYVRQRSPAPEEPREREEPGSEEVSPDIQAILTVIGRRRAVFDPDGKKLDLRFTWLVRAELTDANLSRALLWNADLWAAHLPGIDLSEAELCAVRLSGSDLPHANLSGASLFSADLARTDLTATDLTRADLAGANLSKSCLHDAKLSEASLRGANLLGANLSGVDLSGVDLSKIGGLTHEQIESAITDEDTILPDYLKDGKEEPPQEAAGDESE